MRHTPHHYALALYESLDGKVATKRKGVIKRFLGMLERNHDMRMLRSIINHYEKIFLARHGMQKIEVTSASPLSHHVRQAIEASLGVPVLFAEKVDPSVLAGLTILVDDTLYIDASGKTQINNLF
ncbi:MAG: synthase delta subunit [Candidatus Paceibacter sp.]|nr:synthase delta subunit [Candidatus Paceibacter sp.]